MKKLARFTVLSIIFIALFTFFLCVIPTLIYIFGGSFQDVMKSAYSFFGSLVIAIFLGSIFYTSFDQNFYSKN